MNMENLMTNSILRNKTLLILTSCYPDKNGKITGDPFVKSQVDELSKYFTKIVVISSIPFLPKFFEKIRIFSLKFLDRYQISDYKYANIEVYYPRFYTLPLNFFRKKNGDFAFKATLKCIKKNKLQFDLIHAHFIWISGYVASKLKQKFQKKLIITAHGFDIYDLPFRDNYWKNKVIDILKKTDKIITVSNSNLQCIKTLGFEDITKVIPNGFDSKKFYKQDKDKIKEQLEIPNNVNIILHIGNLIPVKNQMNLIYAIEKLIRIRNDFLLYIIGEGGDRKKIENKIEELKLEKYIKILGYKPHDEIPFWMNAADIFVLPSYRESFGVVNIEALACGTPVVSTINGGSEEIITSKDYGFLLEKPGDYNGLAILVNKALNKKWDEKLILNYAKKYAWENISKDVIKQYEELIK
jgi:teichuronic acid biosynthesis glycosyltransferase TuaC